MSFFNTLLKVVKVASGVTHEVLGTVAPIVPQAAIAELILKSVFDTILAAEKITSEGKKKKELVLFSILEKYPTADVEKVSILVDNLVEALNKSGK